MSSFKGNEWLLKLLNIKHVLENLLDQDPFFYYACLIVMLKWLDSLKEETDMVFHYIVELTIEYLNWFQILG